MITRCTALLLAAMTLSGCHVIDGTYSQRRDCAWQAGYRPGLGQQILDIAGDPRMKAIARDNAECLQAHGLK